MARWERERRPGEREQKTSMPKKTMENIKESCSDDFVVTMSAHSVWPTVDVLATTASVNVIFYYYDYIMLLNPSNAGWTLPHSLERNQFIFYFCGCFVVAKYFHYQNKGTIWMDDGKLSWNAKWTKMKKWQKKMILACQKYNDEQFHSALWTWPNCKMEDANRRKYHKYVRRASEKRCTKFALSSLIGTVPFPHAAGIILLVQWI